MCASSAGTIAEPAGEMPSTSNAIAIVLAVNWPPQAPAPGLGGLLELVQLLVGDLAGGVRADRLEDLAWIVTSRPLKWPGRIEPP